MAWYADRGLATLIAQWREEHPGAVVGTIGDANHDATSDHMPEEDGSVDAGDFMAGNGVMGEDLDALAETLRRHRDPRIAYVIRRQRIFSSTNLPWIWRPYGGAYHGHTHVSVNDRHENDTARWAGIGAQEEGFMADLTEAEKSELFTILRALHAPQEFSDGSTRRGYVSIAEAASGVMHGKTIGGGDIWLAQRLREIAERPAVVLDYDELAKALLRQIATPAPDLRTF